MSDGFGDPGSFSDTLFYFVFDVVPSFLEPVSSRFFRHFTDISVFDELNILKKQDLILIIDV